jgi:site-specific DNA-methyltransferase (adenine-specific)
MNYLDKIIQGDCLELLQQVPSGSVDMTFADPPFNLNKRYKGCKDNLSNHEYSNWCFKWITEMVRVTKPCGSIFIHNIPFWLTQYTYPLYTAGATFRHWITWDAPTRPMGHSLQPAHYGILYYSKGDPKFYEIRSPHKRCRKSSFLLKDYGGKKDDIHPFGPLLSDVWTDIYRVKHNRYRDNHPCQLPIHSLERIILMSTDEGDVVLDPFMGTGTTAIAAKRLGRHFMGFEMSQEYIDAANNKLAAEITPSKLGNSWVSCFLNDLITIRHVDLDNILSYYIVPESRRDLDFTRIVLNSEAKKIVKALCTKNYPLTAENSDKPH